jgi:hypothetical protein|tara:strand:+ start:1538 stop:1837 length:300 start_codon:yes stop_codon:yes gene_type:complete
MISSIDILSPMMSRVVIKMYIIPSKGLIKIATLTNEREQNNKLIVVKNIPFTDAASVSPPSTPRGLIHRHPRRDWRFSLEETLPVFVQPPLRGFFTNQD